MGMRVLGGAVAEANESEVREGAGPQEVWTVFVSVPPSSMHSFTGVASPTLHDISCTTAIISCWRRVKQRGPSPPISWHPRHSHRTCVCSLPLHPNHSGLWLLGGAAKSEEDCGIYSWRWTLWCPCGSEHPGLVPLSASRVPSILLVSKPNRDSVSLLLSSQTPHCLVQVHQNSFQSPITQNLDQWTVIKRSQLRTTEALKDSIRGITRMKLVGKHLWKSFSFQNFPWLTWFLQKPDSYYHLHLAPK